MQVVKYLVIDSSQVLLVIPSCVYISAKACHTSVSQLTGVHISIEATLFQENTFTTGLVNLTGQTYQQDSPSQ